VTLEAFLDHVGSFGFNHLLVSAYANYSVWNAPLPDRAPPKVSPTLRTPWVAGSGYTELDVEYFAQWDAVLAAMGARGMVAHMMLYVGNKGVAWPPRGSAADDIYWHYVMSRFSAFPAVVLDVSKEAGSYGVGDEYIRLRLDEIVLRNSHRRLVTAHSGLVWSNACAGCNLTMVSAQVHFANHSNGSWYDEMLALRAAHPQVPVANVEFMYEAGRLRGCNGSCCGDCASTVADVATMRQVMWDLYMAGGSGAWYDCDTAWDVIDIGDGRSGTAGFGFVKVLAAFWQDSGVAYWTMAPRDGLLRVVGPAAGAGNSSAIIGHVLASAAEYVVHVRENAAFELTLIDGTPATAAVEGEWLDPVTGATKKAAPLTSVSPLLFEPPASFSQDVVLHVRVKQQ
jgi:hypothetical protein